MSRNVQFVETEFPFQKSSVTIDDLTPEASSSASLSLPTVQPARHISNSASSISHPPVQPTSTSTNDAPGPSTQAHNSSQAHNSIDSSQVHNSTNSSQAHISQQPSSNGLPCSTAPSSSPAIPVAQASDQPLPQPSSTHSHHMVTRTRDKTYKKKEWSDFVSYHAAFDSDPTTFLQANKSPHWREAMTNEINALVSNQTWTLVAPSNSQKVIGCKWVFKTKRRADGSIERYKARLVAKGFNQISGIDFEETYSPVVRPTTIRVTISLALTFNWPIRQLDVSNAFLNGDLKEQVFMAQPPGFIDSTNPDYVCLLHKSLYGLRQAPRAWFDKLSSTLTQFGFKQSSYDPSMFLSHYQGHILLLLVYVDDIVVTGSNPIQVHQCVQQLSSRFAIRDLGPLHYFLGIETTHTAQGLCLTQTKYLTDLLKRVNMVNCKPCLSPMASGTSLSSTGSDLCKDPHLYRSVLDALQYATLTRPDLSFSVNYLSQFMHSPLDEHWSAAKRILRYIAGTLDYGLHFYKNTSMQIHAYSDSDWAGNVDDRRSTSGFCVYLGRNLISWIAKKQPTVSRSSTKAEYRSLAICTQEIMWLENLLQEISIPQKNKPILWCNNIGATFLTSNPQYQARTKHIAIDYHFVRERVISKHLIVKFICSQDQLADCLTKPLPLPRFQYLRRKLNVSQLTLA